tara:strand:+ start:627 stop:1124 length:498 start_codon:yes stop_codon:yes gene_type:complete
MNKKTFLIFFIFLSSCSGVEFVYKNDTNLTNPIYDKSYLSYSGEDIPALKRNAPLYFGGNKINDFSLNIEVKENKSKRSVQSNQAASKVDYTLVLSYKLIDNNMSCEVYNKKITSRFSYEPKSSGYNFGSDQSLDRLYELSVKNNLREFVTFLSGTNLNNCINEN